MDKVEKALDNQTMAIVQNIESLLADLKSMGGEPDGDENQAQMAQNPPPTPPNAQEPDDDDPNQAAKSVEGTTGNDKAEAKVGDDLPDQAKENMAALKSIEKSLLMLKNRATKSAQVETSIYTAINALTKVVKSVVDRVNEQDTAITNMLKGFGVVDEINEAYAVEKSAGNKPVQATDTQLILSAINNLQVNKSQSTEPKTASLSDVRKELGSETVMTAIFGK